MKIMKIFRKSMIAMAVLTMGLTIASCGDANEFEDANTNNPSWVNGYTDDASVAHPESLSGTAWVRGTGLKLNAYGEDIQGFVESIYFVNDTECEVKMSQGTTQGTWVNESNDEETPYYEYTYSDASGAISIIRNVKNDKGAVSKVVIFSGMAVSGTKEVITIIHYGDTPVQTYLVKQSNVQIVEQVQ